ncbi:MAG: indole-3-glycerol-phosphate synthase [Opitutales bacterium]
MDKLQEIMAHKRQAYADRLRPLSRQELRRFGSMRRVGPSFHEALNQERLTVIAEVKRRSPSAGDIAADMDTTEQVRKYLNAGVDAMSVLTDEKYFGGKMDDLWDAADFLHQHGRPVPLLRKDFFFHPLQVLEAAEAGARCILIIVRALSDDEIRALADSAALGGLDVLYEVHTEAELERALRFDPRIVGVNNRDLTRFETDLAISERILPQIPEEIVAVSESGIFNPRDAHRARQAGAYAILVGQALMEEEDPEELVKAFQAL